MLLTLKGCSSDPILVLYEMQWPDILMTPMDVQGVTVFEMRIVQEDCNAWNGW